MSHILNKHLKKRGLHRSFIICGGASLILQGQSRRGRGTKDVDVVAPEIDATLMKAAVEVSEELGISSKWLNSDSKGLTRDMNPGWENRVVEVYTASHLQVYSISREDLIFAKFWAYCDRQKDLGDLVDLKVSPEEIERAANKTKNMDGNAAWPDYVDEQTQKLRKKLGYG